MGGVKSPRDTGGFEFPYSGSIPTPVIHDNEKYDLPSQDYTDPISTPSFFQGDYYAPPSSSSSSSISSSSSSISSSSSSLSSSSSSSQSSYSLSSSSSSLSLGPIWADNARVVPNHFRSGTTICAVYDYHSVFPEYWSLIRWFRNDIYQSQYDNRVCFPATGVRGDVWYFIVTPCDSYHCGSPVKSLPGIMINSPPTAPTRAEIIPHNPQVDDDLFAIVSGSTDPDGDRVIYHIKWYRNGTELISYRDRVKVPYTELSEGDIFSMEAKAFDGIEESE